MHKRQPTKGLTTMERRVPKSNRYAHVTATLNTGTTVDKVKFVTAREYAKRRDEIFFRITPRQLGELYEEYERDEYETISEVGVGSGAGPRIVTYEENASPQYVKPYLVLDVRPVEDYNLCHLQQARSFPYTLLRRDQLHPEVYNFRNKEEHLIVLYCEDEKISRDAAKVMVDRGIDNIYLLTGGMVAFAGNEAYIEGNLPEHMIPPASAPSRSSRLGSIAEDKAYSPRSPARPSIRSPESKLTANKLQRHNLTNPSSSTASRSSERMETATARSTMSVAESVISRASARKGKF